MKRYFTWLKNLSWAKKAGLGLGLLIVLAAAPGSHQTNLNVTPASHTNTTKISSSIDKNTAHAPVITTKIITETAVLPFTNTSAPDSALAQGTTKITTTGVNGTTTLTYELTFTDDKQTDKKLIKSEVITSPINQVTRIGTYLAPDPTPEPSCPNGTYINSTGNTICSPYSSPSAPAGATAQCVDGTYSFSQSRSGTCSHHGGVAQWL